MMLKMFYIGVIFQALVVLKSIKEMRKETKVLILLVFVIQAREVFARDMKEEKIQELQNSEITFAEIWVVLQVH